MNRTPSVKPFVPFNYHGGRPQAVPDDVAELAYAGLDNLALQRLSKNFLMVDDVPTLSTMANIYRAKGRAHKAARIYSHALTIKPTSPALQVGYGETLLAMSNPGAAMEAFEEGLKLRPGHARTSALYGLAYVLKGREDGNAQQMEEGLQFLTQLHARKPQNVDVAAFTSRALLQAGKLDQVVDLANRFTPPELYTQVACEQVASIHVNAGLAHTALGDKGQPVPGSRVSRYEMACKSFDTATEAMHHLGYKRNRVKHDEKMFNRLSRQAGTFNGHSHNLLIRIAQMKLETMEKGGAPDQFRRSTKDEVKRLAEQKKANQAAYLAA